MKLKQEIIIKVILEKLEREGFISFNYPIKEMLVFLIEDMKLNKEVLK